MKRPYGWFLMALMVAAGCAPNAPEVGSDVPDFKLTERSGKTMDRDDLKGKVWIASFVFTRCSGPCPQITGTMAELQKELANFPDLRLVTFTVDPERDTPQALRDYANRFGADPERWLFLTGDKAKIHELSEKGFLLGVGEVQGSARTPGNEFDHSTRLTLVDRQGRIRGYFNGRNLQQQKEKEVEIEQARAQGKDSKALADELKDLKQECQKLRKQVEVLLREKS
jgi:cytochrome oxidase Cu insertion factor (SCO1/SenC/PrrC family)